MRRLTVVVVLLAASIHASAATEGLDMIPPVDGPIIAHFDPPPTPYTAGHRGIDIAAPAGSPVVAAADGVVAFAGQVGGRLFVSIDHPGGLRTTYSFLGSIQTAKGAAVAQGDPIATSGSGHDGAADPHLHLGLRRGEEYLDPEAVLLRSIRANLWRVLSLAPVA